MSNPVSTLVLVAHPDLSHSRCNARRLRAARDAGPHVQVRDLYALYPDYLIDVAAEQAALQSSQLIVWQHPVQWYSMPAMMKLWIDEVLAFNWAYGPQGRALQGKELMLSLSAGGGVNAYQPQGSNRHTLDTFLAPYEQTAHLCGLRFLKPWVLYGLSHLSDVQVNDDAARYGDFLSNYSGS
jgi:glutathione-regulated potassium-efflux system ancillary protein KefF